MARIRTIKPEFWTSAQVLECSPNARLLFLGLWNFSDDKGRHPDNAKQCKAEVFPADDFTLADVQGMLYELSGNGLIVRYMHDGKGYFYIPGWHHQRIDKPQKAKYPDPFDEHSEIVPGTLPPDTKRSDTKRSDTNLGCEQPDADWLDDFKAAYPKRAGSHRWSDVKKAINARLREGHTADEIVSGARRYAAWCKAGGKTGTEFVLQAATFVGPNKQFLEAWDVEATNAASRKPVFEQPHERRDRELREYAERAEGGEGVAASPGDARGQVLAGVWEPAKRNVAGGD